MSWDEAIWNLGIAFVAILIITLYFTGLWNGDFGAINFDPNHACTAPSCP